VQWRQDVAATIITVAAADILLFLSPATRCAAHGRIEADLARMRAFDLGPGVKEWRRARAAQGWYRMRQQQAARLGSCPSGPLDGCGVGAASKWHRNLRRDF